MLFVFVLTGVGCADVHVAVRNDTGSDVEVAGCVEDTLGVGAGDTFTADAVPQNGNLYCVLLGRDGVERCVSIPNVEGVRGTYPLSRTGRVPLSRCR